MLLFFDLKFNLIELVRLLFECRVLRMHLGPTLLVNFSLRSFCFSQLRLQPNQIVLSVLKDLLVRLCLPLRWRQLQESLHLATFLLDVDKLLVLALHEFLSLALAELKLTKVFLGLTELFSQLGRFLLEVGI